MVLKIKYRGGILFLPLPLHMSVIKTYIFHI